MKNQYRIENDIVIIEIPRIKDKLILETKISLEDLPKAQSYHGMWRSVYDKKMNKYYIQGRIHTKEVDKSIVFARFLLGVEGKVWVDHINGDTLDNRRENIRALPVGGNNQNIHGAYKNNKTSGIKGVTWNKRINKWQAYFQINKKQYHLGYFNNIDEAEKVAIEARTKHMPYSPEAYSKTKKSY